MRSALRFSAVLVAGLGLLTWVAYGALTRTARDWFEADVAMRAELVVGSARQSLIARWSPEQAPALRALLREIAHDKRIMAVAACTAEGQTLATTDDYPTAFGCATIARELAQRTNGATVPNGATMWPAELPDGRVHVAVIGLQGDQGSLGNLVLVHDMGFISRREDKTRSLMLTAFAVLAFAASVVTLVAIRVARRSWTTELRRMLRGHDARPEYQPLLKDVRELVARLSDEQEQDKRGGMWTPARLKAALSQHLRGERVVIVANREPYIHEKTPEGNIRVQHPASGLVTALEPVMRACSGVWIAHGSGSADRETADARGRVRVPPGEESYVVRRVWLSEAEERGYYYGFSNEGLWPLCHLAHTRPIFRADDYEHYRAVNQRFADAVCDEVDSDDPIVLVQDYHFALVPRMIRERLPRATIITFWHIPWPNAERFGICPWQKELLDGMLGSSILGFHTQLHCNNFLDAVDTYKEARIDRERNAVIEGGRETLVRPYPISTEWPPHWLDALPSPEACRQSVIEELGLAPDALIGVGVDRLDYTKGIEERLLAVERALDKYPSLRGRFTFVQLAAPSRTKIERYQALSDAVEKTADRINQKYGSGSYRPVVLKHAHHEPPLVFRYYRAAHLCYVSSLHDGMNLVAKEFVGARDDDQGVLVLSLFTGAARELTEALIVNPYDLEQSSDALAAALQMPAEEQRERMRAMRRLVADYNVYRWAGRMLVDAAQLRRREQLSGRLSRFGAHALGTS